VRARDAVRKIFEGVEGALTADNVVRRVRALPRGDRWSDIRLRTVLCALAPNTGASRHYPTERRHGFLFALGAGRFRRWDETTDGSLDEARLAGSVGTSGTPARRAVEAPTAPAGRGRLVHALVETVHAEPHQPRFRRELYGDPVVGWPTRIASYFWPHPVMDLRATHEVLSPWFDKAGDLGRRLEDGTAWTHDDRRRAAVLAWQMLTWGGVTRQSAFSPATVEAVFRRALGLPGGGSAPMNHS
jgi:hypothetical protein